MASSSNPPPDDSERIYLYSSNVNVANFVSVKLSGNNNYHLWKAQMLCLLETHGMRGIVEAGFHSPRASSVKIKEQYDSLLKGWIFGSVCEDVLGTVIDVGSAKDIWDELMTSFSNSTLIQDSAQFKPEAKEETKDKEAVSAEMEIKGEDTFPISTVEPSAEEETMTEEQNKRRNELNKRLLDSIMMRHWGYVRYILLDKVNDVREVMRDAIDGDKNTMLHLAVRLSGNTFVKYLFDRITETQETEAILEMRNVDGSTALHVAAIVGNINAAKLLVERHNKLLTILDDYGKDPLEIAYSNMQFETFMYLLQAAYGCKTKEANSQDPDDRMNDDDETKHENSQDPDDCMNDDGKTIQVQKIPQDLDPHLTILGVNVLVNAISAKEYGIASTLLEDFPKLAYANDQVLMALARTFPSGLNDWETLIYPSLGAIHERLNKRTTLLKNIYEDFFCDDLLECYDARIVLMELPLVMLYTVYQLIYLLILMVHFPFFMVYYFMWKFATKLVEPIKDINKKQKEWEEAKKVLVKVCEKIGNDHLHLYEQPILEAARRNVYQVVDEFLVRSPKAIQSEDKKSGHDIIQLAVIHRSETIYSLLYQIPKLKSRYRTFKDPSGNNMLHVAGRLAPSYELKRRTGAALQLQRELQWFEELKKLVFPAYITEENIFKKTPEMVFTIEHENLVKEGETWMKTTAESCSITAALITTIVFAAAITVPGGSNQVTGTPLFTSDTAFIVFATSDAISLFTSTTSLLVFLSILTARFAEEDFLVRLPRRLIIGLCSLFISTTAMMVAFSATLFLVFCDKKSWMLGPICGLACLPIVLFVSLQFPLIVDLVRWTYVPMFGNRYQSRFDADKVQAYFANRRHGKLKRKEKAVRETKTIEGGGVRPPI